MDLRVTRIQRAVNDEELFELWSGALNEIFPPELQRNPDEFLSALQRAPRGLGAMAGIFHLDFRMAIDDLAWYFGNHNDERFLAETEMGLKEREAMEAADVSVAAREVVKPYLTEIRSERWKIESFHEYLDKTGIQARVDPRNERMQEICKGGELGLMQYWLTYARKYPERRVVTP